MKNLMALSIVASIFVLSGCTLDALARFQKELGLTVTGDPSAFYDQCVGEQFFSLLKEYNALPEALKTTVKTNIKNSTRALHIANPLKTQTLRGELITLTYGRKTENGFFEMGTKTIQDKRTSIGGNQIGYSVARADGIVTLNTHYALDESLHRSYRTEDAMVWDKVDAYDSDNFRQAQQDGPIASSGETATRRQACGKPLSLGAFFVIE